MTDKEGNTLYRKDGEPRTRAVVETHRETRVVNLVVSGGVSLPSGERAVSEQGAWHHTQRQALLAERREAKRKRENAAAEKRAAARLAKPAEVPTWDEIYAAMQEDKRAARRRRR